MGYDTPSQTNLVVESSVEKSKEKKERKKERKEKGGKEGIWPTLQEVGFFSYLGCLYLGAIQWPWSLALTLGLAQNSLEQTV